MEPELPDPKQFLNFLMANGFEDAVSDHARFAVLAQHGKEGKTVLIPLDMDMPLAIVQLQAAVNRAAVLMAEECEYFRGVMAADEAAEDEVIVWPV